MAKKKKTPSRRRTGRPKKKPSLTAEAIFEHLRVKHIRLIEVHSRLEIRDGKFPNRAKIDCSANVGPSADGNLHANAVLDVEGRPAEGGESVIAIKVHYQVVFAVLDAELDQFVDNADKIAKFGMWALWPYFRELVQSITSKMAIPTFTLPVLVAGAAGDQEVTFDESSIKTSGKQ